MLSTLEKAQPSDHIVEEIACIEMELLETQNRINTLQVRRDWLHILRDNFMKRFGDFC